MQYAINIYKITWCGLWDVHSEPLSRPTREARCSRPSSERFLCMSNRVIEYKGLISAGQILQSSTCKYSLLLSKAVLVQLCPCCLLFLNICTYVLGKPAVPTYTQSACKSRDVSNECIASWLLIILQGKNEAELFRLSGKKKIKGLSLPLLHIMNGWQSCQRSPKSLEENNYAQLISSALLHAPESSGLAQL